jgi:site-specific DNA-methyltransferase (adenine-specific)
MINLYKGDCLEVMQQIPDGSIDAIITDIPYGTTQCKWDSVIPFDLMWKQLNRIIKPNGAILLFAQDKFMSKLMLSDKNHRYNIVWDKVIPSGHLNAKKMPLRSDESICVFYKKLPTYNPQKTIGKANHSKSTKEAKGNKNYNKYEQKQNTSNLKYPKSIVSFQKDHPSKMIHPTQKPVALMEYLIKTYTNENETVLDFTMGSGSTGVAAKNLNRNFIGIEQDENYFNIATDRINKVEPQTKLF